MSKLEDSVYLCENCDGYHITDKAIKEILDNAPWYIKLGYKLKLIKL